MSVVMVENNNPTAMVAAIGCHIGDFPFNPNAVGSTPRIVVKFVSSMGLNRCSVACFIAFV